MYLGMQDFDFAQSNQICPKSNLFAQILLQLCPNFASILPKSNQICPTLINFTQKQLVKGCGCILCTPSSYDTA